MNYFKEVLWDPAAIERTSMAEIEQHIAALKLDDGQKAVVKRIVHTTGDLNLADKVLFHPRAVGAGLAALKSGAKVFTDVNMLRAGINLKKLRRYGSTVYCKVHRPEAAEMAKKLGITRSAAAIRMFGSRLNNQLVAVGNAPTALFEVLRLVQQGIAVPALIVGMPVGFVGAAQSKELLTKFEVPYITLPGTRGGSPVAAAVINALVYLLEDQNE
ncbi:MAG: precorrin-8X methylmutase [Desulfotomaculum sp.]|nr:precorrin-8X methylmutase [Desulfotomaculum sp.]